MNILEFILLFCILYVPIRYMHIRYLGMKLNFKLAAINDELQMAAIEEKISHKSKGFRHLQKMLQDAISENPKFSFWNMIPISIFIFYRKNIRKKPFDSREHQYFKNEALSVHKDAFDVAIADYIFERHLFAIVFFSVLSVLPIAIFQNLRQRTRTWILTNKNFQPIYPAVALA